MALILFDEAHDELIRSAPPPSEDIDTWTTLQAALEDTGWEVTCFAGNSEKLDLRTLRACDVLFVGGPTTDFSDDEVLAIERFVKDGGGLLVAVDAESLWRLSSKNLTSRLNEWGFQFTRYLNLPPESVHTFHPHYITAAGIKGVSVADINALDISGEATPLALITKRGPVLAACLEMGKGRVLAIGDYAPFADAYIEEEDSLAFALRAFRWLAFENSVDIGEIACEKEIPLGQIGTFSMVLSNPRPERINRVKSTVLSDAGATIEPKETIIRAIPPGGQTWLLWTVEPKRLGRQSLHLSLDLPKGASDRHLYFDPAVSFKCVAPIELKLTIYRDANCTRQREIVTVGEPFWAEATVDWKNDAHRATLTLELLSKDEHLQVGSLPQVNDVWQWQLTAILPGTYRLALKVRETDQYITRLVQARPSVASRIETLTLDILEPLEDRIRRLSVRLRSEFSDERITSLPFRLCSPATFVEELFPEPARSRLLESLSAARREEQVNEPLLWQLLTDIAPTYVPGRGSYIPFDPWLAEHLIDVYALEWEGIAQNLAYAEGMPEEWLEQNLAAYIIHEKYGHGFFFVHTRLGRQLAILFENGFLRKADIERLSAPYPRDQFTRYQDAIQTIVDSSIILNEGFAAWLEVHMLKRLGGVVGQAAYRRKRQLASMDEALLRAMRTSAYFTKLPPVMDSRYAEGLQILEVIEGYFGEEYGPKCAVQAVMKAADVHLGITQSGDVVQFALSPEEMLHAMIEVDEEDDARSDMRLRRIHGVLARHRLQIQSKQESLLCHQTCLHSSCPVNTVIAQELGW